MDSPEALAGIVVADHVDVIGPYDHRELRAAAGRGAVNWSRFKRGLFRSGSRFPDEHFYELYGAIADELLAASAADVPSRKAPAGSGAGDHPRADIERTALGAGSTSSPESPATMRAAPGRIHSGTSPVR
ncbi:hypothetical protein WME90_34785 [Sorangium sp. So ce375]|uniref:hypothetical protein n=1 Tax=Sorangium sp. So ce375 TaxID=3133306 RepID=UPI003F5C34F0